MKLELRIDGKNRLFKTEFISARMFRKLLEYDQEMNYSDLTIEQIDELVGFACEVFDKQFTMDDFYDGLPSNKLISTISEVFVEVRTGGKRAKKSSNEGNEQGE